MSKIKQRKKDHVNLTVEGEVGYNKPTGFEQYHFVHNALPELNMDDVTTEISFMNRTFSLPLFISSMTGGYTNAGAVNTILAEFCETHHLPLGVGSQRIMLEERDAVESFAVVRKKAPTAFIASNIGGAQLVGGLPDDQVHQLEDTIQADACIVHLNPLQELMQKEGDRDFCGVADGIYHLSTQLSVPLIVKETGAGISKTVAHRLLQAGASVIDIAGAGGTSWAKVENKRKANGPRTATDTLFDEWGIPTVESLRQVLSLRTDYDFSVIASGGIRNSFDIAKALCLGADMTASARPVIQAVVRDGREGLENLYKDWKRQMKIILMLLGCSSPDKLHPDHLMRS